MDLRHWPAAVLAAGLIAAAALPSGAGATGLADGAAAPSAAPLTPETLGQTLQRMGMEIQPVGGAAGQRGYRCTTDDGTAALTLNVLLSQDNRRLTVQLPLKQVPD